MQKILDPHISIHVIIGLAGYNTPYTPNTTVNKQLIQANVCVIEEEDGKLSHWISVRSGISTYLRARHISTRTQRPQDPLM